MIPLAVTIIFAHAFDKTPSASCAPVPNVKDQKLKSVEEFVAKVVEAFGKQDIDAIVELSEVPWYDHSGRVTSTKDQVRKDLNGTLEGKPKFEPKFKIVWIKSYKLTRPDLHKDQAKLIDEVLTDDDFVVSVEIERKDRKLKSGLLIKIKDGKPRFVGIAVVD